MIKTAFIALLVMTIPAGEWMPVTALCQRPHRGKVADMGQDGWGAVLPAVITSVLTTLATLGVTGLWRYFSQRSKRTLYPIKLKRGSGNSYELINQSKRLFSYLYVNVGLADGTFRAPIGYPSPTVLPNRSVPLGDLLPGDTVSVQWNEYRRKKETHHYADIVRIREDAEEYEPKKIKQPPMHYGG